MGGKAGKAGKPPPPPPSATTSFPFPFPFPFPFLGEGESEGEGEVVFVLLFVLFLFLLLLLVLSPVVVVVLLLLLRRGMPLCVFGLVWFGFVVVVNVLYFYLLMCYVVCFYIISGCSGSVPNSAYIRFDPMYSTLIYMALRSVPQRLRLRLRLRLRTPALPCPALPIPIPFPTHHTSILASFLLLEENETERSGGKPYP